MQCNANVGMEPIELASAANHNCYSCKSESGFSDFEKSKYKSFACIWYPVGTGNCSNTAPISPLYLYYGWIQYVHNLWLYTISEKYAGIYGDVWHFGRHVGNRCNFLFSHFILAFLHVPIRSFPSTIVHSTCIDYNCMKCRDYPPNPYKMQTVLLDSGGCLAIISITNVTIWLDTLPNVHC